MSKQGTYILSPPLEFSCHCKINKTNKINYKNITFGNLFFLVDVSLFFSIYLRRFTYYYKLDYENNNIFRNIMDEVSKEIMKSVGITTEPLHEQLIPRELLLNNSIYADIKKRIPELKKLFSSSAMTSLQESAEKTQKWPLLNLVRQILHGYKYEMKPIRKSDGYTPEGVKKYKRFFQIVMSQSVSNAVHSDVHVVEMTL